LATARTPPASGRSRTRRASDEGFTWDDATIGIVAGLGTALVAALVGLGLMGRRDRLARASAQRRASRVDERAFAGPLVPPVLATALAREAVGLVAVEDELPGRVGSLEEHFPLYRGNCASSFRSRKELRSNRPLAAS
jgi:hypothetical protein